MPKPAAPGASLKAGKLAPKFKLYDQDEKLVSTESLKGQPYVLYFYPKDNTPGCTREACDFRDHLAKFAKNKVRVLGVSPDSIKSHKKFQEQYQLPFTLISDPDKTLAKAYGVWVKKQNYGREYMGIARSTFMVDERGRLTKAWRGVRVEGHVEGVLAAAQTSD